MCNDFGNHIPYDAYLEAFSETRIPVRFPTARPNLEPREDIWPTETAPVIRHTDGGIEFIQLRWFSTRAAERYADHQLPL